MSDLRFAPEALGNFATAVLASYGVSETHSRQVTDNLVYADLVGVATHGLTRLPPYARRLELGLFKAKPEVRVEKRMPWSASIDADNGLGAVASMVAVDEIRKSLASTGIGVAVVRESNHFGAAGHYARAIAARDAIGVAITPASKSLAPFGSQQPLLGTNPWSVSVPAGSFPNWTMDMATSVAARGHIRLAALAGRPIPGDWALDGEGRPTTDAAAALKGVMLPFAGPKGSALSMLADILGGVLSGSAFGGDALDMSADFSGPTRVGHFFMGISISAFMDLPEFFARMDTLISRLKALKPAAGVAEVMYPGEIEARAEKRNRAQGIKLQDEVLENNRKLGAARGVAFPAPL